MTPWAPPPWPRPPPPARPATKTVKNDAHLRDVHRQLLLHAGGWPPPPRAPAPAGIFDDLQPLLWTLRLVLIFPVVVSRERRTVTFRWLSWTVLATVAMWLFVSTVAASLIRYRLEPVLIAGKHFHLWDVVPKYASSLSMAYIFLLPATCWATAHRAATFIETWQRLEVVVAEVSGPIRVPGFRSRAWAYSAMCLTAAVVTQGLGLAVVPDLRAWMLPSLLHSVAFFLVSSSFWVCGCGALASFGQQLAARIPGDCQRLGPRGLRAHRQLWLQLARLLALLGASWGRVQAMIIGVLFTSCVSISFVIMHLIGHGLFDGRLVWLAVIFPILLLAIISICNSAQKATDGVRGSAVRQLLALSLVYKDTATCEEIVRFLDDIRLQRPELTVCGFAVLSRASILSFFALACTYLVVLSQFTVTSESTTTDFDTVELSALDY